MLQSWVLRFYLKINLSDIIFHEYIELEAHEIHPSEIIGFPCFGRTIKLSRKSHYTWFQKWLGERRKTIPFAELSCILSNVFFLQDFFVHTLASLGLSESSLGPFLVYREHFSTRRTSTVDRSANFVYIILSVFFVVFKLALVLFSCSFGFSPLKLVFLISIQIKLIRRLDLFCKLTKFFKFLPENRRFGTKE